MGVVLVASAISCDARGVDHVDAEVDGHMDGGLCLGGAEFGGILGLPPHPTCGATGDRLAICRALSDADGNEVSDWSNATCEVRRTGAEALLEQCQFDGSGLPCSEVAATYDVSNTPCWHVCFVEDGCWLLEVCWDDRCQSYDDCGKFLEFDYSCCVGRYLP